MTALSSVILILCEYQYYYLFVQVTAQLKQLYGGLYSDVNVMVSGTHTHSGPAAYHQYVIYEITALGFYKPSLDALVIGIVKVGQFYIIWSLLMLQ